MRINLPLVSILLAGISVASCVNLKKIQTFPDPSMEVVLRDQTEPRTDITGVSLRTVLAKEYRNTNTGIRIVPVIETQDERIVLPPYVIEGRNNRVFNGRMDKLKRKYADSVDIRYSYERSGETERLYTTSLPYTELKPGSSVYADYYADAYTKSVYLGRYELGGIPDLACFIERDLHDRFRDKAPAREEYAPLSVEPVVFEVNSSHVITPESSQQLLREYLQRISDNPEILSYKVRIQISNSPEGSLAYNRKLGRSRADAILTYVTGFGARPERCDVAITDEDWDGLLAALPEADIEHSADIEKLIISIEDPDSRELAIRGRYGRDYATLLREVYPSLRRGEITVSASVNEEAAATKRAHAAMVEAARRGDYTEAAEYAGRISDTGADNITLLNKAVVLVRTGHLPEAELLFKRLADSTPEARYNLGTLQLAEGKYEQAEQTLREFFCINNAIACIYTGKYSEAADILLRDNVSPERNYLLALVYKMLGSDEKSAAYLESALEASPGLAAFHDENPWPVRFAAPSFVRPATSENKKTAKKSE